MEMLTTELRERRAGPAAVLVVDDSKIVHMLIKMALEREPTPTAYPVASAMDASERLRIIDSDTPDIIVTDAMMSGVSGFDLIREAKSRPQTAGIPVILLTSLEGENGGVMNASGKADICLPKPFTNADILTAVQRARGIIAQCSYRSSPEERAGF